MAEAGIRRFSYFTLLFFSFTVDLSRDCGIGGNGEEGNFGGALEHVRACEGEVMADRCGSLEAEKFCVFLEFPWIFSPL
jgi:hypothetical protein